nr:DUF930 domain-containing protein [Devosia subaequoris]
MAASVGLHLLFALVLALLAIPEPFAPTETGSIAVELLSEADYAELVAPEPAPEMPHLEPVSPEFRPKAQAEPAVVAGEGGMVAATEFFAADILNDPSHREVQQNFPLLASREQVIQLCNIEALEQLRDHGVADNPDALVGYAFDGIAVAGLSLEANGGAFRAAGRWHRIRYHCEVAPDIRSVSQFSYAVGALVPESQWEAHFLNSDDDWLD